MRTAVWVARSKAPAVALAWPPAPQTHLLETPLPGGAERLELRRGGASYTPAMLEIHEDAVEPLKGMGALRITAQEADDGVELQIDDATEPQEGDEVVERDGARVFLDSVAAEVLADQVLGVDAHGDHFHFTFDDQSG
jgi:iron-sulfur cluster assembly protein